MEDYLSKFFSFHKKKHPLLFWVTIVVGTIVWLLITFLLFYLSSKSSIMDVVWDIYINLLASLIAFVIAYEMVLYVSFSLHRYEDEIKVSYKNSDMEKQYGQNYLQKVEINNLNVEVYCEPLLKYGEYTDIIVDDDPDRHFELDTFIKSQAFELLAAHSKSKSVHDTTVRLYDFVKPTKENGYTAVMRFGRSSYLAHLLTNRVLDYPLKGDITIRSLYENTDTLTELRYAKMSNHLGINALVFVGNNERRMLLVPRRGKDATVVKNGVTASMALRLKMDTFENKYASKLTKDYIVRDCIEENIASAIKISKDDWQKIANKIQIVFLGLARDIYEGGKPTLFYAVDLNITEEEYWNMYHISPTEERGIDEVEEIMLAQWESIEVKNSLLSAYMHLCTEQFQLPFISDIKGKKTVEQHQRTRKIITAKKSYSFEQNLISNIWFYQQYLTRNGH